MRCAPRNPREISSAFKVCVGGQVIMATTSTQASACTNLMCSEPDSGNYFVSTYPPFSTWTADQIPAVQQRLETPTALTKDEPLGLYIHIPFCARRCHYCYYLSYAGRSSDDLDEYIECLLQELAMYRSAPALGLRELSFVYFGGGTPSLLSESQLAHLLSGLQALYSWRHVEESTFECAPQSVTAPKLQLLRDMGITRISLGVQDLNDEILRLSGRVHLVEDVMRAYDLIRHVGFDVVNLDMIAGLCGQTDASFSSSIQRVIEIQPDCLTIYPLEIPHNTPLYRRLQTDAAGEHPASWDTKRARLATAFDQLEAAGYTMRSAYAAARDPHRQRFVYQDAQYRGADLLGIGASAFSYLAGTHSQNMPSLEDYGACLRDRRLPLVRAYALTDDERLIREFILHLKLGFADVGFFQKKFQTDIRERFARPLASLQANGWLSVDRQGVRMTRQGLFLVDRLLSVFYLPQHQGLRYT
ncbi:MAG: oxygen-independent coproporphyrinogen III oxidase [Planctomycetia bacterium]